ncbi:DNA polymerase IV [Clostridium bornimense]|uniref:DNA polymerase IV n=1 Tax=Clostridium bornimense TaxID=1216932 RepID=UPI001C124BAD|nr:DNA polymerase IV [Clostridium bornimense]MBU5314718.1 DNA polymerase IV [Clostridium bornimense]
MDRVILHVDMDAFFSAVEVADNPRLKGKPVIVGGKSERGVVSTCSYEARKYGVRSAMPIYKAKVLCPNGVFLPVRYGRYVEVSKEVFKILFSITENVEKVSIDEAYLDVTDINEDPKLIALKIKSKVLMTLGLTISVGISYNKFLAKLASDWNKPNGLKVITKEMIPMILYPLPIERVHGLGKQSARKLHNIGIRTIEDLYGLPKKYFSEYFGKFGIEIYDRIRGIDNREVVLERERKSVGKEITLKEDTKDIIELKSYIKEFSNFIAQYLEKNNICGKTITVKIKTASFENHTKSKTFNKFISSEKEIYEEGCKILDEINIKEYIRLIGVTISSLDNNNLQQLTFY